MTSSISVCYGLQLYFFDEAMKPISLDNSITKLPWQRFSRPNTQVFLRLSVKSQSEPGDPCLLWRSIYLEIWSFLLYHRSIYQGRLIVNRKDDGSDESCDPENDPHHSCWMKSTYNGNKIESSPIRSVIIRVINKIWRPRSGSLICQSGLWLQTELDGTRYCYQLIITVIIHEKNKCI